MITVKKLVNSSSVEFVRGSPCGASRRPISRFSVGQSVWMRSPMVGRMCWHESWRSLMPSIAPWTTSPTKWMWSQGSPELENKYFLFWEGGMFWDPLAVLGWDGVWDGCWGSDPSGAHSDRLPDSPCLVDCQLLSQVLVALSPQISTSIATES